MFKLWWIALAAVALVAGCGSGGPKHDLEALRGKIHMGMSELEVTRDAGAPTRITEEGDLRKLRYESSSGPGFILVTLRQNVVIEVERKD